MRKYFYRGATILEGINLKDSVFMDKDGTYHVIVRCNDEDFVVAKGVDYLTAINIYIRSSTAIYYGKFDEWLENNK